MRVPWEGRHIAEDGLEAYLADISRYKLLKADEEKDLARRMEIGDDEARAKLSEGPNNKRLETWKAIQDKTYVAPSPENSTKITGKLFNSAMLN